MSVHLDIDGLNDATKLNPGGLVIRRAEGNNAPRKKISLSTDAEDGDMKLTRTSARVKVFTQAEGGTGIAFDDSHNIWPVAQMPANLYVQGDSASASMRDVTLTLTHLDSGEDDSVKFTVLWVDLITTKHTANDDVTDDNAAKPVIVSLAVPWSSKLGYQLRQTGTLDYAVPQAGIENWARHGIGSEFAGSVKPSNFDPGEFGDKAAIRLNRDIVSGSTWEGLAGDGSDTHTPVEAGSDFDEDAEYFQDFDPQSGESPGKIYDWDAPGRKTLIPAPPANTVYRHRTNFEAFADFCYNTDEAEPQWIHCSQKKPWYTRQSYKRGADTARCAGIADAGGADTLTKNQAGWTPNEWKDGVITILTGTGQGQVRAVKSNTADTITTVTRWNTQPAAGSTFLMEKKTFWVPLNDLQEADNKNADGSTKVSWDLKSPTVTGITPNEGTNNGAVSIDDLAGTSFAGAVTVKLTKAGANDIQGTSVVVVNATKITCTFDLTGVTTGQWNVVVTNPADSPATLANGFTVNEP